MFTRTHYVDVKESDAEFILSLRLNKNLNSYISETNTSLGEQRKWLVGYLKRHSDGKEFYYKIIDSFLSKEVGTIRIYNISERTAEWGSWLIDRGAHPRVALESIAFVYDFIFNKLEKDLAVFSVRNDNVRVLEFHKKYGAKVINKDEIDTFFEAERESLSLFLNKYLKVGS